MNQVTRTCKNNNWQQRFFVYKLNDGSRYTLEYWFNVVTGEKRVYCKELYESIGEGHDDFGYNFNCGKFPNSIGADGTSGRSQTCDLKDALSYAIDRFKLFRDTFKECGLNALESKEDGDLLGMIANTAQVTKEEAAFAITNTGVTQSLVLIAEACKTEEQLDAFDDIGDTISSLTKQLSSQRRARLQAEKKAALLEVEVENERAAKEEAIKINLDREQRNIKTLREELKQYFVKLNWNRLVSLLKGKSKFNDKLKPTWCAKVGTVNSYYSSAPYIFEAYLENDEYWHLQYKPGKKEKALSYLHDLYQEDLDNESKACGGWLFR